MSERYAKSEALLDRALKTIPLGSQTFSKSITQYPYGVSPYFITRGQGAHVWDVDGHEYIDCASSLAAVTLGHNDPDVNAAVLAQMQNGVIFSLAHPLEVELAEKIVEMVPCAEMVRYGKNGSDATAGAIRLARAYTGRDHVLCCGYHGWQDWYIGSTARNMGVPAAVSSLTHSFEYNNLDSMRTVLLEFKDNVAAVIMEPMNYVRPEPGFLEGAREMAHQHGAVYIFDELITGFRFANGGAQEYFGVVPDLATYGKGLSNGYPLSAICGRADIMRLMEDIFFSFTYGGETLSIAASLATLKKLQRLPVLDEIAARGQVLIDGLRALIDEMELHDTFNVSGHPSWSFFNINDTGRYSSWEIKTLYLQEMLARGVLTLGTHDINYAHSDDDIKRLLECYREVMGIIKIAVLSGKLYDHLRCQPIEPLFKVR